MVTFELWLVEGEEDAITGEWNLIKQCTSPALPRAGEYIDIGGEHHTVREVTHRPTRGTVGIECYCSLFCMASAFLETPHDWKIMEEIGFREDEERFRQELQRLSGKSDFTFAFAKW
jgi:hypothetical protein